MMQSFASYIESVAVFLVLSSFVLLLVPKNAYQPYIKLALGCLLVLVVAAPLAGLSGRPWRDMVHDITVGLNQNTTAPAYDVQAGAQNTLVLQSYEESLQAQLDVLAAQHGVTLLSAVFSFVQDGVQFGMIRTLQLEITLAEPVPTRKPFIRIEPIRIPPPAAASSEATEDAAPVIALKKAISDFYTIAPEHIYCNIRPNTKAK